MLRIKTCMQNVDLYILGVEVPGFVPDFISFLIIFKSRKSNNKMKHCFRLFSVVNGVLWDVLWDAFQFLLGEGKTGFS